MKFEIFSKENLGSVRTIYDSEKGEVWFFANDVLEILGYTDISHTIADHTALEDRKALKYADWVKMTGSESMNRKDRSFINESGLYCLVFGSEKPKAKEFKFWVTREVLPSIRKYGAYAFGQEDLKPTEKEAMLEAISRINRQLKVYEKDSNFWFESYHRLLNDYEAMINAKSLPSAEEKPLPKEVIEEHLNEIHVNKEGWIIPLSLINDK